jgi:hypothetical protein
MMVKLKEDVALMQFREQPNFSLFKPAPKRCV